MKKSIFLLLFFILLALYGCGTKSGGGNKTPKPEIKVDVVSSTIEIKDEEVETYDYTSLFIITKDGEPVKVEKGYIDTTSLQKEPGEYTITLSYEDQNASVLVKVLKTIYELSLEKNEVTVNQVNVANYDFLSLFHLTKDGVEQNVSANMVSTNLKMSPGDYFYRVSYKGLEKELIIHITDEHDLICLPSYTNVMVQEKDVFDYDFTQLFSLYVDGVAVEVIDSMITAPLTSSMQLGESYSIVFYYEMGSSSIEKTVSFEVVENDSITIYAKNIVIYPNSEYVDLKSLFEIYIGNQEIEVLDSMITGFIDYSKEGINEIICSYEDQTATAAVEIKKGVIIQYAHSDFVTISKGTNQNAYAFSDDFILTINGERFSLIPDEYFDLSSVDFNTAGSYEVTLKIPYNENKLSLSGVKFDYYTKTITYKVVDRSYKINVKQENVLLPKNTTKYDVLSNIQVVINSTNQALTTNPAYVDSISCYVEILEDISFDIYEEQEISIAVYVNGPENEPVIVTYKLAFETDVKITPVNKIVFEGTTVFPSDLFQFEGQSVEEENLYYTGKIDTFHSGVYTITAHYLGIEKNAIVTVLSNSMKGRYQTLLTTIPSSVSDSSTTDDTEASEEGDYEEESNPLFTLSDMIFNERKLTVNSMTGALVEAIDENTFIVTLGASKYTFYYQDGIVILIPDNSYKLSFTDFRRPLIYFHADTWELLDIVTINYGKDYVLSNTYMSYSIDTIRIRNRKTQETKWFGLNVELIAKTSADTIYNVNFGEVFYEESFEPNIDVKSSLEYQGKKYEFTMTSRNIGKVNTNVVDKPYANLSLKGMYNGVESQLVSDSNQAFYLKSGSNVIFSHGSYDITYQKYGGADKVNQTLLLYTCNSEKVYAYKFLIDVENQSFTYVEKDIYYGFYVCDTYYIFLDGYGTGIISFDSSSYYQTPIEYQINGYELLIRYVNINSTFTHGDNAVFSIHPFLNVLTPVSFDFGSCSGKEFENQMISDGMILHMGELKIGTGTDKVAKENLYNQITIITKDGELSKDQYSTMIDTSKIRFNTPGFYQLSIKATVNGTSITSYYAVQLLKSNYADSLFVGAFGEGVIYSQYSIIIDEYGRVALTQGSNTYEGLMRIVNDEEMYATLHNGENQTISIVGKVVSPGIISIRATGSLNYSDYYTTGTSYVAGTEGFYLRKMIGKEETIYFLAPSLTNMGERVEIVEIASNTYQVESSLQSAIFRISEWNNSNTGIILSDGFRGIYTNPENTDIFVDGFGYAIKDDTTGSYTINGITILISFPANAIVVKLYTEGMTYTVIPVVFDETLVAGKTYEATYTFTCGGYPYIAISSFAFHRNGKVTVYSSSNDHDSGEDSCTEDMYEAGFGNKDGMNGTYTVNSNQITVIVGTYTFTFVIYDFTNVSNIVCTYTSVGASEHGYFANGTTFTEKK